MSIQSLRELKAAQEKLQLLKDRYALLKTNQPNEISRSREWTMRSLKQLINQFTEEIARFEARKSETAKTS